MSYLLWILDPRGLIGPQIYYLVPQESNKKVKIHFYTKQTLTRFFHNLRWLSFIPRKYILMILGVLLSLPILVRLRPLRTMSCTSEMWLWHE